MWSKLILVPHLLLFTFYFKPFDGSTTFVNLIYILDFFSTYELFLICGVEGTLLPWRLCSFSKCSKEEAILSWKWYSDVWSAFKKAEGILTMVNNGMENAPLQSAGAVLIWGPSLQVEEELLYVETCPETQCRGDRFGWAWWGLSIHGHRCGQPVQVPMPQCSSADSCTPSTAPHLLSYPVKLKLSQRLCASQLLLWILGHIRKQELF